MGTKCANRECAIWTFPLPCPSASHRVPCIALRSNQELQSDRLIIYYVPICARRVRVLKSTVSAFKQECFAQVRASHSSLQ